ncbi:cellulase-like family protein [uncultured Microbacterium sp.]|uniref:cellulase-like family protein n=1 Tax=uncultured Microbacterium sp. TaxID=191216 RepID=UPI0035CAFE44
MRPSFDRPYAITMWDFSWLERRWPGAGYEDWDQALGELVERGYDAVRIDAYPHLVSADPTKLWQLNVLWNQQSWGAQSPITVQVLPALIDFLRAAKRHGVGVALSTWFREDVDNTRMSIRVPEDLGRIWADTLKHIDDAGLLDTILYVDLCNEFPLPIWSPWLYSDELLRNAWRELPASTTVAEITPGIADRSTPRVIEWMRRSINVVRAAYPDIDYTYSMSDQLPTWKDQDVTMLDVLEPHVWLASNEYTDYYDVVGYDYERFDSAGYDNVVRRGRAEYEQNREKYDAQLFRMIDTVVEWSRVSGRGLYITECWSLVDYKDWPGLEWDWILDINARAVEYAAATGRFVGIATSNFCGPQFVGMWREVQWHQRLTSIIKNAPIDDDLRIGRGGR